MAEYHVEGYRLEHVFGVVEADNESEAINKALNGEWKDESPSTEPGPDIRVKSWQARKIRG